MYPPRAFVETDLAALDALVARDPFATLISTDADGLPCATHLPILYARDGERIVIEGHWARTNPQAQHAGPALLIVHGPHAYISPGWYPDKHEARRVPTWNYAAAHLHGRLEISTDADVLAGIVDRLSQRHETAIGSDWRYEPQHAGMLRGIVGFRFVPERIDLRFKLSQNHPVANVRNAAEALQRQASPQSREVAGLMLERLAQREDA